MAGVPKISESEWKIMKVLWKNSPSTANQVIDKLKNDTDWKPKTVKTLLNRLVKKKAIGYEVDKRTYHYFPLVNEDECIMAENKSFLERVHNGTLNLMIASFLKEEKLSKEEIEELKRILDEKAE